VLSRSLLRTSGLSTNCVVKDACTTSSVGSLKAGRFSLRLMHASREHDRRLRCRTIRREIEPRVDPGYTLRLRDKALGTGVLMKMGVFR
jgi:hypothetical protein